MKSRKYTILLISRGGSAPRSLSFTSRALLVAAALFIFMLAGIAGLIRTNARLTDKAVILTAVEAENERLHADLQALEQELTVITGQMAELEELEQKVRVLVSDERVSASRGGSGIRLDGAFSGREEALDSLKETIPVKTVELEKLVQEAAAYRKKLEVTPNIMPVDGRVTSPFGLRRSPFTRRSEFHTGVDLGAPRGTPVYAAAAGEVIFSRYKSGYGKLVIIHHGTYKTYYAHLRKFLTQVGERVEKGQQIGEVGSTGYSTGPHLHYEIHKNDSVIDPLQMIKPEVREYGT